MSESYNQIFVFDTPLAGTDLLGHLVLGLRPVWQVLGRPAHLFILDTDHGKEEHLQLDAETGVESLKYESGTILNIRGKENRLGTVQFYELDNYGVVCVARPVRLLSSPQRREWMRILWSQLRQYGALFAVGGSETDISISDVKSCVRDWTTLQSVPLVEFVALSDAVAPALPPNAVPLEGGFLLSVLPDESGGLGTH